MANSTTNKSAISDEKVERDTLGYFTNGVSVKETNGEVKTLGVRGQPKDFVDYAEYLVNNTVVSREKKECFKYSDQDLFQRDDISCGGFEWVKVFSWTNESSESNVYTREFQEGLVVREGEENEVNFGISGAFKGLGISFGGSHKTFTENETSTVTKTSQQITVPPNSTVYFYQKQYKFATKSWWGQYVPDWDEYNFFDIGKTGNAGQTITRTAEMTIQAEEYATLLRELKGSTTITVSSAPYRTDEAPVNRQYVNSTATAKQWLGNKGVTGSG